MARHRQTVDVREVGDAFGLEEAARVAQIGVKDVGALVDDEVEEAADEGEGDT